MFFAKWNLLIFLITFAKKLSWLTKSSRFWWNRLRPIRSQIKDYLSDSHTPRPSCRYGQYKSWCEIEDSGLESVGAGNGELECCDRCFHQIPDEYSHNIHDRYTLHLLNGKSVEFQEQQLKDISKYENMLIEKDKAGLQIPVTWLKWSRDIMLTNDRSENFIGFQVSSCLLKVLTRLMNWLALQKKTYILYV